MGECKKHDEISLFTAACHNQSYLARAAFRKSQVLDSGRPDQSSEPRSFIASRDVTHNHVRRHVPSVALYVTLSSSALTTKCQLCTGKLVNISSLGFFRDYHETISFPS